MQVWSKNQVVVALSASEVDLYALVRGASKGIGIQSMLKNFGIECVGECTDSSAAIGVACRRSIGKFKHIARSELGQCWR